MSKKKSGAEPKPKTWIYTGDYPTRAGGVLVYPGGKVKAAVKPGKNFKAA